MGRRPGDPQPGSIAQLALAVPPGGHAVAYVPGLVMRRPHLYPGEAKTDRRDAYCWPTLPGPSASRSTG